MGTGGRLGDGGIEDPDIRPDSIDDPDIRPDSVDNPEIRPESIDDPDIRPESVDDPNIRPEQIDDPEIRPESVDNPDIRPPMIDNPDLAPQPMSGGLPVIPIVIGIGVVVVAIAAFSILGGGAPAATNAPGSTTGSGVTNPPSATAAATQPGASAAGPGAPAAEMANLTVDGAAVSGSWTVEGGADLSPTSELIAGVWTGVVTDPSGTFGDFVTISLSGTIVEGTQSTSAAGIVLGIAIRRDNADGSNQFDHVFTSKGGECQVTMRRTGSGVSGTFACTGITDLQGNAVDAQGSFAT